MITRRNFIKLAGMSAAALGAGYSAGKLINIKNETYFAINGFIPADEKILRSLVNAFKMKIKSNAVPVLYADERIKKLIYSFDRNSTSGRFNGNGRIEYRIQRLNENFSSDIIVSDNTNPVFDPLVDFNLSLAGIRENLKNQKADYIFSAVYKTGDFLSNLFYQRKDIIVENERGITEIIKTEKNYNNVSVKGPLGSTVINVSDSIVKVQKSCCRNQICRHSVITQPGQIIACAPNKILIHFEV